MGYQLQKLPACHVTSSDLASAIEKLRTIDAQRYRRLWAYYRNPMRVCAQLNGAESERPYRQAQEWGLPSRITGMRSGSDCAVAEPIENVARKEVVIENDIAWRIETMVDALFGKSLVISSSATNPQRREAISKLLRLILAHNGGVLFLQQLALIGAVYGFVDVLVKLERNVGRGDVGRGACASDPLRPTTHPSAPGPHDSSLTESCTTQDLGEPPRCDDPTPDGAGTSDGTRDSSESGSHTPAEPAPVGEPSPETDDERVRAAIEASQDALLARLARMIRLEIVEPARALPLLAQNDYRQVELYVQCYEVKATADESTTRSSKSTWLERLRQSASDLLSTTRASLTGSSDRALITEVLAPDSWQRYEDEKLLDEGVNSLGQIPLVHVQNTAVPFEYSGVSDVEPLIPLQDELNTRMSDRAHRITLQSFRMYLGKGAEGFTSMPVAPGRMWMTDNENAEVIEFGGDSSSPSEDAHLSDVREAMDKTSGVSPIAAGAIKGRIGRLTSAAALRVTMQALLAKTEKKRTTYGFAIARMCELALAWLDRAGLFQTLTDERRVELSWPSPLPENELEKLQEAEAKLRIGIPRDIVIRELGY